MNNQKKQKQVVYLTDFDLCRKQIDKEIKKLQEIFCITNQEIETGRAPAIFESDPDYIKISKGDHPGNIMFVTYETSNKLYIISNIDLDIMNKEIVEWWLNGAKNDLINDKNLDNNWNDWSKVKQGIAYRGGSGYVYSLFAKEI